MIIDIPVSKWTMELKRQFVKKKKKDGKKKKRVQHPQPSEKHADLNYFEIAFYP